MWWLAIFIHGLCSLVFTILLIWPAELQVFDQTCGMLAVSMDMTVLFRDRKYLEDKPQFWSKLQNIWSPSSPLLMIFYLRVGVESDSNWWNICRWAFFWPGTWLKRTECLWLSPIKWGAKVDLENKWQHLLNLVTCSIQILRIHVRIMVTRVCWKGWVYCERLHFNGISCSNVVGGYYKKPHWP